MEIERVHRGAGSRLLCSSENEGNAIDLRGLITKLEEVSGMQAVIDEEPLPAPVPRNYVTDLGLISRELGWQPEIDLEAGLKNLFTSNQ